MKYFHKVLFGGPLEINLSTDRNAGRGKVAYNWIFPDPTKVGSTLEGVLVIVVVEKALNLLLLFCLFLFPIGLSL